MLQGQYVVNGTLTLLSHTYKCKQQQTRGSCRLKRGISSIYPPSSIPERLDRACWKAGPVTVDWVAVKLITADLLLLQDPWKPDQGAYGICK